MTDDTAPSAARVDTAQDRRRHDRRRAARRRLGIYVGRVVLALVVLGAWEIAGRQEWISQLLFSRPSLVWAALVDYYQEGALARQTWATAKAVGLALMIGVPAGILVGFVLAAVPWLDEVIGPYLVPLNSMPRIALVPVFIIWFGLSLTTKVAVAVSIIFFMVLFNARAGVKGVDPDLLVVSRLLGLSRRQIYQKVVLPGSVPGIFAGVRLAVTYAILGVVASEMIAAREGLGLDIVRFANTLRISGVFAILLVLALGATVISRLLERFERWLLRWQ